MTQRSFWLLVLGLSLIPAAWVRGDERLRVAVKEAPPFAIQDESGVWSGIAVDLWDGVARDLGLPFELEGRGLPELLAAVHGGEVDVGLGALTVTAEREAELDFTHPFYASGVGVAARYRGGGFAQAARRLLSADFLQALGALCAVLLLAGVAVWAFERRRNAEQFGGSMAQGLGSAFWWSAVTMTTVGYGDKAPRTLAGRLVALVWMFASVITISGFTAAIASTLTVTSLESELRDARDLERVRVGAIEDTTGAETLTERGISYRRFGSVEDALDALAMSSIDAVVHDQPLLVHATKMDYVGVLKVVPWTIARQDYAVALPSGSPLRESVNGALLRMLQDGSWAEIERRYLGTATEP